MPKVTFDVSGSDPDEATRAPEPPRPGIYKARLVECTPGFKKGDNGKPDKTRPRLEVAYQIVAHLPKDEPPDEKHEAVGAWVRDYLTFDESTQRRMDQFLQAFGLATKTKRKGEFDTDKLVAKKPFCKLRVRGDSYTPDGADEPVYSAKAGGVFKWDAAGGDDEGFEEEKPAKAKGSAKKAAAKAEPEELDLEALGVAADEGDDDAAATLTEKAEEAGLDTEDYATWAALAEVLGQEGGDAADAAGEGDEEDLEALGAAADEEGDDSEAAQRLTELAGELDEPLDPDDYGTWAELAEAINEAQGGDPF